MSNSVDANVLIIGKSGVGKSSLLNYIFDKEIEETGTGKPVTKKGIFSHRYKVSEDFYVNLYDTWGLEANKATEWKKIIQEEVEKHDCGKISDWFHAIFYCFSAKSARVEDFEVEIINGLITSGNKVVVILTHCDVNNIENSIKAMSEKLCSETSTQPENIIKVCSVNKKLLGGKSVTKFGKEEVLTKIRQNLWNSICVKIPIELKKYSNVLLKQWNDNCCNYVDKNIKFYNYHSDKVFNKLNIYCNNENKELFHNIEIKYLEMYIESFEFYNNISGKLNIVHTKSIDTPYVDEYIMMKFSMGFKEKIGENIATFLCFLIPVVGLCVPFIVKETKRNEIKRKIGQCLNDMQNCINDAIKEKEDYFKELMIQ